MSSDSKPRARQNRHKQGLNQTREKLSADFREKEKQPKFKKGTKQYKRNNIIEYALQENLKEYGWSIEPPKNYKQVYKQQELFPR